MRKIEKKRERDRARAREIKKTREKEVAECMVYV